MSLLYPPLNRILASCVTQAAHSSKETPAADEGIPWPNYSESEDCFIVVANNNIIVDWIREVGQKGETSGLKSMTKLACCNRRRCLVESGKHVQMQTKDLVQQRWKMRIAKSAQLWSKYYKTNMLRKHVQESCHSPISADLCW